MNPKTKLVSVGIINKASRALLIAIALFLMVAASSLPATAQQSTSGSGLSISPTVSEFTLKPGAADILNISLKNVTTGNIIAKPFVNDFESDNATGNPKIITDPNRHSPNSIKNFVSGLDDVPLVKGEQKKITVTLQAPPKNTPGAFFGIIRYKAVPAGVSAPKEGELTLSASVGTIVLITVPGNLRQQLQLTAVHIYNGPDEGSLFLKKPTDAGVELNNLGNDFAKPFGTVTVEKMFGGQVYSYQLNTAQPRSNILPASSRIFKNPLKNIGTPGRYTVTANVSYGNGNDVLVLKKTFWYIPLWLTIILLVIVLASLIAVLRAYRGYKRGNRSRAKRK